jgi:ssDNA-binding Zn-finger/Zn-ribbon topoisomerase 1
MKKATATLYWSLDVECPNCKHDIDLAKDEDFDTEGFFSYCIFNNKWNEIENSEIECPNCKKTFLLKGVEY